MLTTSTQHAGWHLQEVNEAVENACAMVMALEGAIANMLSLTLPWMADSPHHLKAIALHQQRDYHQLLDELEYHAISCQFEVEKMGLPRTGILHAAPFATLLTTPVIPIDYKARQQIVSLVSRHGKTLQSMINKYNALAVSMNPPKPKLTWKEVTDLDFISDIVML